MKAPKPPAPVAYSYIRFSSPEQAKGDSIRRQEALRDEWCRRNGVQLDTSLRLRDEGVSAFRGHHRERPDKHALAEFLELVRRGKVARGSYLVIESLDRLSREEVDEGLELLLGLTRAGIRVVQLQPTEIVYQKPVDPMKLVMGIMELSRGNSESAMKSQRVSEAWARKREAAAEGRPLTRNVPAWMAVRDG
ncbi:MAG TPA: recombinase family protein, partial [Fimbriiglobus sp.]|nr:recombinase family protein [Fimbriiglobus sp.]